MTMMRINITVDKSILDKADKELRAAGLSRSGYVSMMLENVKGKGKKIKEIIEREKKEKMKNVMARIENK
jgi:antitoxin component of RelBE/YafQ-DinJ toxin-antitoxin module